MNEWKLLKILDEDEFHDYKLSVNENVRPRLIWISLRKVLGQYVGSNGQFALNNRFKFSSNNQRFPSIFEKLKVSI